MAYLDDTIEIRGRKTLRNWLIGIGLLFGLAAYGATQNGDAQAFLISAGLCAVLIFAGCKVKTHRKLDRYGGVYR